jgi:hypothetical protein
MRAGSLLLVFLFGVTTWVVAQDMIYTASGKMIPGKITEIGTVSIKYKDYANLDGPLYVIVKSEVVLIKYQNGVTEVINSNPNTLSPKTEQAAPVNSALPQTQGHLKNGEKPVVNLYYLNSNLISINALALANGDVTLLYDREVFNSRMSLTFLGGYSFNPRMGGLNLFIADSKDNAKKKYDLGFGINFMPRNTRRVQYFMGILGKYMSYNYRNVADTLGNQKNYENASAFQMSVMFSNGWIFRVSPNFNFKVFGAIGAPGNSVMLKPQYSGAPKVYLGYCFGYRF